MQRPAGAVPDGIELAQPGDTAFKDTVPALFVHVLGRVARERSDHFHSPGRQVIGQRFKAWFRQNSKIIAVDHAEADRAGRIDKVAEELTQLRRAARQIDHGWTMLL